MKAILIFSAVVSLCGSLFAEPIVRNAGNGPLLFSEQFFPVDESGEVINPDDAASQAQHLISSVGEKLEQHGSSWEKVARVHLYVVSAEAEKEVREITDKMFGDTPTTWVVSPLPKSGALVALDVVAMVGFGEKGGQGFKVLPAGARIFVSGQAARVKGMEAATRATMEQLEGTLEQVGRSLSDAVQIKSFLEPMEEVDTAREVIESFFPEGDVPPLVFVEWNSSLPIEIELVVADGKSRPSTPSMEFLTPVGMTASPVFCRVVRVNYGNLLFVSGLNGDDLYKADEQVNNLLLDLQKAMEANESDMRHLAKATYYVSENDVSTALNRLRPDHYDPARPPAASKATVAGCGDGSTITIDMIAVEAN